MIPNTFIDIISSVPVKDAEGFVTKGDTVIASIRAFKEIKNASEKQENMAQFSTATALFKFRRIPDVEITTAHIISDSDSRYNILSVDSLSGRGMYVSLVAEKIEGSG